MFGDIPDKHADEFWAHKRTLLRNPSELKSMSYRKS